VRRLSIGRTLGAAFLLLPVWMTALVLLAGAEERRQPSVVNAPGQDSEQKSIIAVRDGRLSVEIQNQPLSGVLDKISRAARVAISVADGLGSQRVSGQFEDVPLAEGLRLLLQEHDAFFFFGGNQNGPSSLRAAWVYPKGRGRSLMPVPPQDWASTKELEARLADPDPEWRALSAEALLKRKRDQARGELLLQALKDEDDRVRTRSLDAALRSGVKPPADVLVNLALGDPAPHVRFLALEALASDPGLGPIVEQAALNDPNPHVRKKAKEILRERNRAKRLSPGGQRDVPAQERAGP
jgi:hypothetical protein